MFAAGKPLQPSLIFGSKAGATYRSVFLVMGKLLTLLSNIRFGLKGLPGANARSNLPGASVTKKKGFYSLDTWTRVLGEEPAVDAVAGNQVGV